MASGRCSGCLGKTQFFTKGIKKVLGKNDNIGGFWIKQTFFPVAIAFLVLFFSSGAFSETVWDFSNFKYSPKAYSTAVCNVAGTRTCPAELGSTGNKITFQFVLAGNEQLTDLVSFDFNVYSSNINTDQNAIVEVFATGPGTGNKKISEFSITELKKYSVLIPACIFSKGKNTITLKGKNIPRRQIPPPPNFRISFVSLSTSPDYARPAFDGYEKCAEFCAPKKTNPVNVKWDNACTGHGEYLVYCINNGANYPENKPAAGTFLLQDQLNFSSSEKGCEFASSSPADSNYLNVFAYSKLADNHFISSLRGTLTIFATFRTAVPIPVPGSCSNENIVFSVQPNYRNKNSFDAFTCDPDKLDANNSNNGVLAAIYYKK